MAFLRRGSRARPTSLSASSASSASEGELLFGSECLSCSVGVEKLLEARYLSVLESNQMDEIGLSPACRFGQALCVADNCDAISVGQKSARLKD
jgi:hypothetical protein